MNPIYDGEFYLIARYLDNSYKIINLNFKKYLNLKEDYYQKRSDLSFIDYLTINYDSKEELIKKLYDNKIIKTLEVDLYIVHPNKYKDKIYLNEFNILCSVNNDLKKHLLNLMYKRLNKIEIGADDYDIKYIADKFLAKISYNNNFYKFVISPDTKIDKFLKENLIKFKNNKNPYFMYFYIYKNTFDSYINLRNMVDTIVQYENLKKEITYQTEEEFYKKLMNLYIVKLDKNNDRKKIYNELIISTNKKIIEGQITLEELEQEEIEENDLEFLTEKEIEEMTNKEGYKYAKKRL